jgi:hypothetical protein
MSEGGSTMLRAIRATVIAIVVAVSLLGSATIASADPGLTSQKAPPARTFDITWE